MPAFRVGKTPYGVLPVTSLRRYPRQQTSRCRLDRARAGGFHLAPVAELAGELRHRAAHANSGDPDAQLVALLGMDASSMTFRGRKVLGDDFLWNYCALPGHQLADHQSLVDAPIWRRPAIARHFGYNAWDPRVIHLGLENSSFPVPFPTVQGAPLSETMPLTADADLGGRQEGQLHSVAAPGFGRRHSGGELSRAQADVAALQNSAPVGDSRLRRPGDTAEISACASRRSRRCASRRSSPCNPAPPHGATA